MVVTCHATGEKAVVQFNPYSKARERYRELNGSVVDEKGEVRHTRHTLRRCSCFLSLSLHF